MLAKRLDLAAELAMHGPDDVGRQLCAAIFLEHGLALADDDRAKRSFLECLLLLQMESLLLRFARACYGSDVKRSVLTTDEPHRSSLSFPSGNSLVIDWAERGEEVTSRRRFAAFWSARVLAELSQNRSPAPTHAPEPLGVAAAPNHAAERKPVLTN